LVDELIKIGHAVSIIDDLSTGKIKNINKEAKFIRLNLGSFSAFKVLDSTLKGVDYVFHLASIPRIQYCLEHSLKCHDSNVNGTLNLLNACAKNKQVKKFVHASSCMVYGDSIRLTISEDATIKPQTIYGVQKHIQELYVNLYARSFGLPSVILRYFGVYGTRRHSEGGSYPNVTAAFSRDKKAKNKIFIYGDGKQSRDMVHVFDIVRATVMAMESKFCGGEVFNVGTGRPVTVNEIASYYDCPIEYAKPQPDDIRHCTADIKKTKKLLRWESRIPFAEGIRGYLSGQL
jgi:UDP-glucose 4-epimerase